MLIRGVALLAACYVIGQLIGETLGRLLRIDANVGGGLNWTFEPEVGSARVLTGETKTVFYRVTNRSAQAQTGMATFNVTPDQFGGFFNKIQCFCFTEQTLQPGESVDMPVVYFVDPDILNDPDTASIKEITLSYTFYPVDKPKTVSAAPAAAGITN